MKFEDAEVLRSIRSLLNKLTVERFDDIYAKPLTCGILEAQQLVEVLMPIEHGAFTLKQLPWCRTKLLSWGGDITLQSPMVKYSVRERDPATKRILACASDSSKARRRPFVLL